MENATKESKPKQIILEGQKSEQSELNLNEFVKKLIL